MPIILNVILSVAFAAAVGGAVQLWRRHNDAVRREDLRAMAARRGWALTETDRRLGRAGALRVAPRGGPPWQVRALPGGAPEGPSTLFDADAPRWGAGTLLLFPAGEEAARDLRRRLGPDWARLAEGLDSVPAPEGIVALARPDPSRRADLRDLGRALAAWQGTADGPAMLLGPEGLRLRVGRPLDRADRLERFIDLGLELGRLVRP